MDKKYELLKDDTINVCGHTLYRIRALKDFGIVKKGDLGGYIEKEENLSHIGNCWIDDIAKVYDNARVYGNARVWNNSRVYGKAMVYDNAYIFGNAEVYDNAKVYDYAWVSEEARIYDNARVYKDAIVFGNAEVFGETMVSSKTKLYLHAWISSNNDYLCIGPIGTINDYITFYRTSNNNILIKNDYFNESIEEFEKRIKEVYKDTEYEKPYLDVIKRAKDALCLNDEKISMDNKYKKYEFTDDTVEILDRHTLYRIKALKDFGNVKKGDIGGYIEKEDNLSHFGTCWVGDNAKVYGNAKVENDAIICNNAIVSGGSIYGQAIVCNNAKVYGSIINENARVSGNAMVHLNNRITDNAVITGNAQICNKSDISDNAKVSGSVRITGTTLSDNIEIRGDSSAYDCYINGDAKIYGNVNLYASALSTNAYISDSTDYITIGPIGSTENNITFYKTKDKDIWVSHHRFTGGMSIKDFEEKVKETYSDDTVYKKQYLSAIEFVKINLM